MDNNNQQRTTQTNSTPQEGKQRKKRIIRLKRRHDEEPVDALRIIPCKREKRMESQEKQLGRKKANCEGDGNDETKQRHVGLVAQRVNTLSQNDVSAGKQDQLLSELRANNADIFKKYGLKGTARIPKQTSRKGRRDRLSSQRKAKRFSIAEKKRNNDISAGKKDSSKSGGVEGGEEDESEEEIVELETEGVKVMRQIKEATSEISQLGIVCNGLAMKVNNSSSNTPHKVPKVNSMRLHGDDDEGEDCGIVYDFYVIDDSDGSDGIMFGLGGQQNRFMIEEELVADSDEEDGEELLYADDDDSNDEDNWRNDYPDEDEFDSETERDEMDPFRRQQFGAHIIDDGDLTPEEEYFHDDEEDALDNNYFGNDIW
eukprot:m.82564 g.82564  ORF g.82564 m.82564 type:complete len:371 (+) comp12090_c0_seq2:76-1188(+)